jgi:hypothetical protein
MERKYLITQEQLEQIGHYQRMFELIKHFFMAILN